jgi:hypothetical protein
MIYDVYLAPVVVVILIVWLLDLQRHMQSVPITTKLWIRIPMMARCTRYNIIL